jgi:hypothetical protein
MYNSHPYQKSDVGSAEITGASTNIANISKIYPVIYTEFGDNNSSDYGSSYSGSTAASGYSALMSQIEQDGVNYTGFAWWIDSSNPAFPTLIQGDWASPSCINGGCDVQQDMTNNPGTSFSFTD